MSGHTSGPWQVVPKSEAQSPWIVGDYEGGRIADCEPPGPWMSVAEANANARLIAAAPELLDALREASRYLEYLSGSLAGRFVGPGTPTEALAQANAAIAKANGGVNPNDDRMGERPGHNSPEPKEEAR